MIDKFHFLGELMQSKRELTIALKQFEEISDPLLIDHIIFRIGAAEKHMEHLFRLAREFGISFDGVVWEWTES